MPSLVEIGTINFDQEADSSLLPAHLAKSLSNVHANDVEVHGNRVKFKVGMFSFAISSSVLVPFGFGDLTVDSETREVRYCLSYRQLVISSVTMFAIVATSWFARLGSRAVSKWMIFLPVLWFFGTFADLTHGVSRFEGFLERCVAAAPRTSRRPG